MDNKGICNIIAFVNSTIQETEISQPEVAEFQQEEKTNSGYKHNNKVSHGIFNLTFRMLQHTCSEVAVTKSDEIKKTKN